MKKCMLFLCTLMFILGVGGRAIATIYVPNYGDTGWQTFSYTFPTNFTGNFIFLVSDYGDTNVESYLLVDNLSTGPTGNAGFELGDFTGYTTYGNCAVVTSFTNPGNNAYYTPTEGSYMALLNSVDGNSGVPTTAFGGTDGSFFTLASDISFSAGDTFSFDWAFATTDYSPYYDFSLFALTSSGQVVAQWQLAQVAPEPTTFLLLGSGLIGLASLGRKRMKKS